MHYSAVNKSPSDSDDDDDDDHSFATANPLTARLASHSRKLTLVHFTIRLRLHIQPPRYLANFAFASQTLYRDIASALGNTNV